MKKISHMTCKELAAQAGCSVSCMYERLKKMSRTAAIEMGKDQTYPPSRGIKKNENGEMVGYFSEWGSIVKTPRVKLSDIQGPTEWEKGNM